MNNSYVAHIFITSGCDSIFLSEQENFSVESRDDEQGGPLDVEEEPERSVEWASQLKPMLRRVVEIFMVEAE